MDSEAVTGVYTYRSLLNRPEPVGDFNKIRFAEAEMVLLVGSDGTISGTLAFPAAPGTPEKSFLDLSGRITDWDPVRLRFTALGRAGTDVFDYVYDYEAETAPAMPGAIDQRLAIAGTVVRSQDHGTGEQTAKAGVTASFVAVQRPFVEPRDVPEVGLIEAARVMLASRVHRLHHTVWHTLRGVWWDLSQEDRDSITALNWPLARPPFTPQTALDLDNGAGEDFLFMHRRMIAMVRTLYEENGTPAPTGWTRLPPAETPQFAYAEQVDPAEPGTRTFTFDPTGSGFAIPPATEEYLSVFPEDDRANLAFLKSAQFFRTVMRPHERIFRSSRYLASLPLGALGNLLEFTIHNQMHMRWTTVPRHPNTGTVGQRGPFDFNPTWDDPRNDNLSDFYSSHVNPVFWRLHGWVDDRIDDWFRAHEAAHPSAVRRRTYKGVEWFEKGEWVATAEPFDQPRWWDHGDHHHGPGAHPGDDQKKIDEMLAVMDVISGAGERDAEAGRGLTRLAAPNVTSFATWLFAEDDSAAST